MPKPEASGKAAKIPEKPQDKTEADIEQSQPESTVRTEILVSPVKGTMIPVSEVKDETFAAEILGTTVAIEPEDGQIKAPCDGEVMNIFETGHAVSIVSAAGGELLIHAGIDTVKMSGKGFKKFVSDGDRVHKGDVLLEMDLDEVKKSRLRNNNDDDRNQCR